MLNYIKIRQNLCVMAFMAFTLVLTPLSASKAQDFLVDPPCEFSTCISILGPPAPGGERGAGTIAIAQHALVEFEAMPTHLDLLLWEPEVECAAPQPTGAKVHKQISRALDIYDDNFCTNQGCRPTGKSGECL